MSSPSRLLLILSLVAPLAGPTQTACGQTSSVPELPRVTLDTAYRPPTTGTILRPADTAALRSALVAAQPGDRIVLRAGTVYEGPFELPAKSGPGWIYIESSDVDALPLPGDRVGPGDAAHMPKIVTAGSDPALKTQPGAHHVRLVGLELAATAANALNYGVVVFGDSSAAQTSASGLPHDLVVDRCYVHGNDRGEILRGVVLNSASSAVVDSCVSNFHSTSADSQAILGWTGPGPFKVVNNYLEGAGENVFFGGADSLAAALMPSDVEIRRNHCFKPLSWKQGDPSYAGVPWVVKNLLEIKCARRVLVEGNTLENCWASGQTGEAIAIKTVNQDGRAPWTETTDVTVRRNLVRGCDEGVQLVARDNSMTREYTKRVLVQDNVFVGIRGKRMYYVAAVSTYPAGNGSDFRNCEDVVIDHNTSINSNTEIGILLLPDGTAPDGRIATAEGFRFTNNVAGYGAYGILGGQGDRPGLPTIAKYFDGGVIDRNVVVGGADHASEFPGTHYFPDSFDAVGFVKPENGNYRLAASSPFKSGGTDGRDPGADVDALEVAIAGVSIDRVEAVDPATPDFRIKIVGANFAEGASVYVGSSTTPWPTTSSRKPSVIVLTDAKLLRQQLGRAMRVAIRVVNPNGDEATRYFAR